MRKKVTIQDIADSLGISRNTVSKAINNSEGLADATRERILQKAVELGYKQFSYVGSMRDGAASSQGEPEYQGQIALLTTTFLSNSHFASLMLDKFQQELAQLGYTLNTHRVTAQNLAELTLPITLQLQQTRGIVCIEMFDWNYGKMLSELGVPMLFVDGPARCNGESLPVDQLYMDNTTQVTRFVNDMLRQGQSRIGFVGNYGHCQSFYERYTAFLVAMFTADVPVRRDQCIPYLEQAIIRQRIASMPELPDVFLCANDFVALDVIAALRAIGKRVPEDVRVCGFDDSAESRHCDPPMTTIHIHTQIMAFSAIHLLISRIRQPSLDCRTVYTETELIYRKSTQL